MDDYRNLPTIKFCADLFPAHRCPSAIKFKIRLECASVNWSNVLLISKVACVAWRFWLGALSNKGGRGQRNREEIRAGATWKTASADGGLFWVCPYASVRIVPIGSDVRPSIKYFGNLPWESFDGLNKLSPQNKIKISKERWPELSVVDLEYLTGKEGNCIEA